MSRGNKCHREREIRHAFFGAQDYWLERFQKRNYYADGCNRGASLHRRGIHPNSLGAFNYSIMFSSCRQKSRVTCSNTKSYGTTLAGIVALP